MSGRVRVAIAAMFVMLATAYLSMVPAGSGPMLIRLGASIVLLFGIAFLGAAVALILASRDRG
jgi:hypothetical protein